MDDGTRAIVEAMEAEVLRLEADAKLPSEPALMRQFGVKRHIVRKALAQLEGRFLVRRVQGAGTFVNSRLDYMLSSGIAPSLHETFALAGGVIRTFVLDASVQPVPADVAACLGPAVGDTSLRLIRLCYLGDELVGYLNEWVSPRVLPEVEVGLRAYESLTELFRAAGADPVRSWTRVVPDLTPAPMATQLAISEPVPAWRIDTFTKNSNDGEPLMVSRGWMRQDRVCISVKYEHHLRPPTCCSTSASVHGSSRGDS
ncbi:GntR family transcriptional regulator [Mycolicibacterium mengxianglii]|uniref:GntR family transcriptional regulator n=1 Tax=Mycolicibacterium mengxianglii TaxID=2736649 RepID=UPI0018D19C37|nr:GntR family transcriptional regulator [Mycolicibacterium mengxianglii]